MEKIKKIRKLIGIELLALSNIALIVFAVLFTMHYSKNVYEQKSKDNLNNFCNTVDAMRQISENYLASEFSSARNWASYIEKNHMTKENALAYVEAVDDNSNSEAHIVDMETFDAWSSRYTNGSNIIDTYRKNFLSDDERIKGNIQIMEKMFAGEKCVLSKFKPYEQQRVYIAVGTRVTLLEESGTDRDYLLLRLIPIDHMKSLWVFPTGYSTAQIGMIATNADYIVPSNAMRSETFLDFVRYYNFQDDYYGADNYLAQLKTQKSGLMELKDSRGQLCYWYYSRLEAINDVEIIGYVPVNDLGAEQESLSIVLVIAVAMLIIILIDDAYILSINKKLRKTAKLANQANLSKTQFLSAMSHDIRTPLNAVLGMTELAQSKVDDTEYVRECLRKITISGNHLLTLINDILDISRVESGRITLNPMPFNVRTLVSNLESLTRSQAIGHGLAFTVEVGELPYATLSGDKLRLSQIYLNLLNNAVKYTKAGGAVNLKVYEENATDDGYVTLVVVVRDNGMGMSEEFQKTMYDSFTRVADSRVDKIQGTGLGLAIVKRMVILMNGTIECDSTLNVGTTFEVRIPLTVTTDEELPEAAKQADTQNSDLCGLRLLIAEDNDINWEIISSMLGNYGIICDRAENGRECVDFLTASAPGTYDIVMMDVQMPLLNGLEATREIRSLDRTDLQQIPIAAMTADAFAEDVQGCIDAGMNAHISKPIQIDKVLAAIRTLLAGRKHIG